MIKTYRTIFISDVHLGTRDCKASALNNFLKHNTCDTLYLVGDIIDAWRIQQNKGRWKQSHTNVVRRILGHAKRDTRVIYVAGNHDEFLRPMIPLGLNFGSVELCNQCDHMGVNGKKYLVTYLMELLVWHHGLLFLETRHMTSFLTSTISIIGFVVVWVLGTLALASILSTRLKKQ